MKTFLFNLLVIVFFGNIYYLPAQNKVLLPDHFSMIDKQYHAHLQRTHQSIIQNNFDLKYHRFFWVINPALRYISGSVTSYFTATSSPMNNIQFELSDSLSADSAFYAGNKTALNHSGNLLSITLNPPVVSGKLDSVTIFYHGAPPANGSGSFENYVHTSAPSMYTLSEPYGASDWWPSKNDLTDKIDSIDVYVVMPKGNHSASNGILVSEKPYNSNSTIDYWKHRYPIASYLICVAVTNYARYSDYYKYGTDSLQILNYVYPEDSATFRSRTPDVINNIRIFEQLFGPYPFRKEKYGQVECNIGGGMEHQTMTFLGRNAFNHFIMTHELAHHWFGNMVTCGSWEDIWLNEGFATYSLGISDQYLLGESTFQSYMKDQRNTIISQQQGSVFCSDTTDVSRIFSGALSYSKGSYLLHMLRWLVGDQNFFQALKNYMNDPAIKNSFARTLDLKHHFEIQSGKDLTNFFAEWFYGSGIPIYNTEVDQLPDLRTRVIINQTQYNSNVSFYNMVIPIEFKGAGKDTTVIFDHTYSGQTFYFNTGFRVDSVFFDPQNKILYYQKNITLNQLTSNRIIPEETVFISPNPVKDILQIHHNSGVINSVQIFNLEGKQISTTPLKQDETLFELNIQTLQPGMYILKTGTADGVITQKFIVTK